MKKNTFLLLLLLLTCLTSIQAQKNRGGRKKTAKVETPAEDPRFTEMLGSMQRTVIIDSLVVDMNVLLSAYTTNPEEGRLATYSQFFNTQDQPGGFVCVNELGNKCFFSMNDNGTFRLYSSDLLGNEWSMPEPLQGIDGEGLTDMNYPFMMPDGQTFYFAARNGDALGGYDLYRTRFDAEGNRFLTPENLGLPFNSEADDFLYVISEQDSIGFFASTRRQPEGKACVYVFVPSASRQVYDVETMNAQAVRSLARIDRIRDTWGNGEARSAALKRLNTLRAASSQAAQSEKPADKGAFTFVVNDHIVYHRLQDFKESDNADRMNELLLMQRQLAETDAALKRLRDTYEKASSGQREQLRNQILPTEEKHRQLVRQTRLLEKEIRNKELTH